MPPQETDEELNRVPFPLSADPAAGALIGTFLVALCMGGPVALVLVVVVWIVYEAVRHGLLRRGCKRGRDQPGGS
jgi:hypothetical protein